MATYKAIIGSELQSKDSMTPFTKSADSMEHEHQNMAELRRELHAESNTSSRPPPPDEEALLRRGLGAESNASSCSPPRPPPSEASDDGSHSVCSSRSTTPTPAWPQAQRGGGVSTPFLNTAMEDGATNASNRSGGSAGHKRPFLAAGQGSSSDDNDSMPGTTCEIHHHRIEPHPLHRTPYQHNVRPDYDLDKAQNPWVAAKFKVDERQRKRRELHTQRQRQQQQHHHNSSIDGLPTLPFHSHQELSLAERCIKKLVSNSQFFPPRAGREDWFQRPSDGDGGDAWGEYVRLRPESNSSLKVSCEHGVAQEEVSTHVTTLYEHEVEVSDMLGRGGFCEVRLAYLHDEAASSESSSVADQENDPPSKQPCYAIKYLSPTITKRKSKRAFSRGAADLAIEARFLSLLSHDHIIRLHYVSAGTLRENYNCLDTGEECGGCSSTDAGCNCLECAQGMDLSLRHLGYFLLLDRLHETLDRRIKHAYVPEVERLTGELPSRHHERHRCCTAEGIHPGAGCHQKRWMSTFPQWLHHQAAFIASRDGGGTHNMLKEHLAGRLGILRDVASAVQYLHEHHIIFRDIKPDNIGFHFDSCDGEEPREVPKLFDFGLVKELKPSARVASITCHGHHGEDAVYKLTGRTGSRRYMCPEVAFSRPYNRKVDIYSFGVLLYEMTTLVQPFTGYTIHRHEVEVLRRGFRPCLAGYDYWPRDLACLIEDCWSQDMRDRPTIDHVLRRLDGCIDELTAPPPGDSGHMTTARSILASISQLSLSQRRGDAAPASPSTPPAATKSEERECASPGRNKVKQILASVPSPPLAGLRSHMHKKTAPQA